MAKVGRKRKYKTVKSMQKAINRYFEETETITVTGLAYDLGFNSRQALINYEGYSPEFNDTIKRAKLLIERSYEVSMRVNGRAGDIFGLKNFGWTDKSEVIVKDKDNITDAERADLRALLRTKKPLKLVKGA